MVTTLLQNDTRILNYIWKHHLLPPSKKRCNLKNPQIDSGLQIAELTSIIKNHLKNKVSFQHKI